MHLYEDLIIGTIYKPTVNSLEIFDELERKIVTFSAVSECICLIGRVACEKDYIDLVDFETLY